ncbi:MULTISPECIES: hypothetical protein [unclassified Leptolyngbya]|uniref:hypothetical protein n=1 Tax=unclassified Leptolyngbya TaxID=2650499 RepID=UPI001686E1C5|nr:MULTISPECIES: hypothetical protein [unclassified Leptolyngbya]MBD1911126.1 hypothetical protein [Leptolyngbya sp. FACHB-8]MBD2154325.1 hypothetical protein [Leptolyngbya sp. FACHB-16]
MYKNTRKDWVSAALTASLGAGIATTFAVSQGQNPLIAIGITAFATVAALVIDHYA